MADDILPLYKTQNGHQIPVWSYERLIGFDQGEQGSEPRPALIRFQEPP